MSELSELGPFAACVVSRGCVPFIAWLGDGRLLAVNLRFKELTGYTDTARLQSGEREMIMAALGSLLNASRMIGNVRRVSDRDRPDSP